MHACLFKPAVLYSKPNCLDANALLTRCLRVLLNVRLHNLSFQAYHLLMPGCSLAPHHQHFVVS